MVNTMREWKTVNNEKDIVYLMNAYSDFHDACLVEASFKSGYSVDEEQAMHFPAEKSNALHMIFHSQSYDKPLELIFSGVRKYCIAGWQNYYYCDIMDCYLKAHNDLITGRDDPLIVWADDSSFNPKKLYDRKILDEPITSFVIADNLKWRFLL